MDSRKLVCGQTAVIAVGEIVLCGAMVGVFAVLGLFKMNVLWGALVGCLTMIVNYFLMAVTVTLSADRAKAGEVEQAQKMMRLSSATRLLLMGVLITVGIKLGANVVALVLPLVFVRPILMLAAFFRKKDDGWE